MLVNLMENEMRSKFLIVSGAVFFLGMSSAVSYAEQIQPPLKRGEMIFSKFDANGDGKVSYVEYTDAKSKFHQKRQIQHMERLDVDKDGAISVNEFSHWDKMMQQHKKNKEGFVGGGKKAGGRHGKKSVNQDQRFERCDYNKDGKIERSEMQQAFNEKADKIFAKKDKNNDGVITKDEMGRKTPEQRFAEHDINGDGKIDKGEMAKFREARSKKHFEMKDKNNDGYLDQSEFGKRKWKGGGSYRGNMK